MEFRILGSLQVLDDGHDVSVAGGKSRALLAIFLVHANHAVSEDVLIDALWGETASAKAADNLHVLVSRLRRVLGSDRVVRDGGGYLLRVEDDELDVDAFEQLRAEGRQRQALDVWRGPPLADFTYEPWAQNEIRRLEELRLLVLAERIEAELASGRHSELVGELHGLVAEHPLREGLRRQLILALYRSGRQAEALDAYRDAKRMLDEELGLEPSPVLRALEGAVLRQDPELDAPRRVHATVFERSRRRGFVIAAVAAALAFGGAAAAVALVDRGEGARRASAAPLPGTTTKTAKPLVTAQERPLSTTTRVVVIRDRPRPATRPKKQSTAPRPAPPPPPVAANPSPARLTAQPRNHPQPQPQPQPKPKPKPKPAPKPVHISDDFDDGIMNRTIWHRIVTGTGVELAEQNGRLEVAFQPDALAGGDYNVLSGHYGTACRFLGDFDVRVDYELLDWPAANGVLVQMSAWSTVGPQLAIARQSQTWAEEYASFSGPSVQARPSADARGTLRIKRVGNLLSTRYKSGRDWHVLGYMRSDQGPMIAVQAYSTDEWFADKRVRVAFDNFSITADQPVC